MTRFARILVPVLLLAAAAMTGACYTIEGIGKDLQALGKGTADAARDSYDNLSGQK